MSKVHFPSSIGFYEVFKDSPAIRKQPSKCGRSIPNGDLTVVLQDISCSTCQQKTGMLSQKVAPQ